MLPGRQPLLPVLRPHHYDLEEVWRQEQHVVGSVLHGNFDGGVNFLLEAEILRVQVNVLVLVQLWKCIMYGTPFTLLWRFRHFCRRSNNLAAVCGVVCAGGRKLPSL